MQKIFVKKNEIVAELIEEMVASTESNITLVVPKKSRLMESESNFRLLSREADMSKKKIVIESVDEDILSVAREHGFESIHPLFENEKLSEEERKKTKSPKHASLSDIIHPSKNEAKSRSRKRQADEDPVDNEDSGDSPLSIKIEQELIDEQDEVSHSRKDIRSKSKINLKMPGRKSSIAIGTTTIILIALWFFGRILASADVVIDFKETPWTYEGEIIAEVAVKNSDISKGIIPSQFLEDERSTTQFFHASGESHVSRKSTGIVTIYNEFSSDSQLLVATTRFLTPDGKLYRLDEAVTVPGAEIVGGEILPASLKASITADKPGEEFNLGEVERLSIPGFKGTARYEKFYGVFEEGTRGGFVGVTPVPTDEDINAAISRVEEILRASLQTSFLNTLPKEILILPNAVSVDISSISINEETNDEGNFSAFGKAKFRTIGFKDSDLKSFFDSDIRSRSTNLMLKEFGMDFENVVLDLDEQKLTFSVNADGSLIPDINKVKLAEDISGKFSGKVGEIIYSLPDVSRVIVSIKPLWIFRMPGNIEKINISVE